MPNTTLTAAGLSSSEVEDRVRAGKVNTVASGSGRSVADIVKANVFTRINAMLGVLLVIVLSTGSIVNSAFGLLIIANSAIGIVQELRAKRTLDRLALVGQAKPIVRRDGATIELSADQLVVDDVVEIGSGDQVMVDGEVIEASGLELDESMLTGESDPIDKSPGDPVQSGSFVVAGTGAFRATKVGQDAYAAKLAAEASKFSLVKSELVSGINTILRVVTWLLIPVGLLIIWAQLFRARLPWREAVVRMAGALVPMVPEGLVLLTSVAFAVGVVRLGRRQCLVNELPAIEGLARVDVVCADKTGTLTEQGMQLRAVEPLEGTSPSSARAALTQMAAADPRPNASIAAVAEALGVPARRWRVTGTAPFTSAKKWSGVSFSVPKPEGGTDSVEHWVIGAPDVLAAPGSATAQRAETHGLEGLRVLLLGRSDTPVDDEEAAPGRVTPVALIVLEQRIRPDAGDTLAYFGHQQVTVKVISGDNALSVGAVTSSLGVPGGDTALDARELPAQNNAQFVETVNRTAVFGRVTPEQKRQMVGALQSRGHTVAMTGDGVNDVMALKDADIGVAMGSGSPATRSVAKLVLLDDRFATLPHVVAEGRRVIGNIERVANLFLSKTVYSVLLALLIGLWQRPFPFQPIHVTITGWFTIGVPAFIMSFAPNNERAKPHFARRVLQLALPSGVIAGLTAFVTLLLVNPGPDATPLARTQASSAALVALIMVALWILAVVARPYQLWRVGLVAAAALFYVTIFALPFTRRLFLLDITNWRMLSVGILAGAVGAALVEVSWWVVGRLMGEPRRFWAQTRA